MKKIFLAISVASIAASAQAGDIQFYQLASQGYEQDSAVAPDLFKNQGLLLSDGVVTACGGGCISSPAQTYTGMIHGQFVVAGTTTQSSVTNLTFDGITALASIDLFDIAGNWVATLTNSGQSEFVAGLGTNLPTYSYDGSTAIGSFTANLNYEGFAEMHFDQGAVPEPASWAMMLGGFGLVGGAMRSRKRTVRFA